MPWWVYLLWAAATTAGCAWCYILGYQAGREEED